MRNFKLGLKAVKTDSRTLKLGRYFTSALPAAPSQVNWHNKGIANFGMMLNDSLGDCTIAGLGHAIQIWSSNAYKEITVPDSSILTAYEQWCGYVPGNPATDQGGIELDVLTDFKKNGLDGHELLGFADPDVGNLTEIKQAINLFGGLYIGLNVPNSVMNNLNPDVIWTVVPDDGGIAGGHCVYCLSKDTSISLLDGRDMTIKELAEEYGDDPFWVYSYDYENDKLVPGLAHGIRKTKTNAKVYKITLDTGESFVSTDDHQFQTIDGKWKFPDVGESLVALYRTTDEDGYERSRISRWAFPKHTHKIVASFIEKPNIERIQNGIDFGGWVVHHKWNDDLREYNKTDNRPTMIEWMRWVDHQNLHKQSDEQREVSRRNMQALWDNPEWRESSKQRLRDNRQKAIARLKAEGRFGFQGLGTERMIELGRQNGSKNAGKMHTPEASQKRAESRKRHIENDPELAAKMNAVWIKNLPTNTKGMPLTPAQANARRMNGLKCTYERFGKNKFPTFEAYVDYRSSMAASSPNHKVVSIEFVGYEDVYDLTVDGHHNFALSCGIFAHNCTGYNSSLFSFVSWGQIYKMTHAFWLKYVLEAHALLSPDWFNANKAPSGFNLQQLTTDLSQIS